MGASTNLMWPMFWLLPALAGLVLAFTKPPEAVVWVNDASSWWSRRYLAAKAKGGLFVGGIWRWLILGFHKLHGWTENIEAPAVRAGVRAALFFYVGGLSLFLVVSAIYLVIVLAMIVFGFWLLGKFMGGQSESRVIQEPDRQHGFVIDGPREQACRCKPECPTSAIITEYSCGCRTVDILNDTFADDRCSNFGGMRQRCGARGSPA